MRCGARSDLRGRSALTLENIAYTLLTGRSLAGTSRKLQDSLPHNRVGDHDPNFLRQDRMPRYVGYSSTSRDPSRQQDYARCQKVTYAPQQSANELRLPLNV